jgi:ferredoxin
VKQELHIAVDRIKCDGHGLCAEILPELIRLDDWGYPIVANGPIPAQLLPLAQRATVSCPVLALAIRRSAGRAQGALQTDEQNR